MDVDLSYFELPLCTDTDSGKVELIPWPFLLPSVLVSLLQQGESLTRSIFARLSTKNVSGTDLILSDGVLLPVAQVRAMIDQGYLSLLVGELGELQGYWKKLLLDFDGHPAHGQEARSIPLTLYGDLFTNLFC